VEETTSDAEHGVVHVRLDNHEVRARGRRDRRDQLDDLSFTPLQQPTTGTRVYRLKVRHAPASVNAPIEERLLRRQLHLVVSRDQEEDLSPSISIVWPNVRDAGAEVWWCYPYPLGYPTVLR
jgi:hypothetical protein